MKQASLLGTLALLICTVVPSHAQRDLFRVTIKTTHVGGNIHMAEGAGGNIGVSVGTDGMIIVDDQFAPLAGKTGERVSSAPIAGSPSSIKATLASSTA